MPSKLYTLSSSELLDIERRARAMRAEIVVSFFGALRTAVGAQLRRLTLRMPKAHSA